MRRLRDLAINLSLSLVSVLVFLALCEFLVFRYLVPGTDAPRLDYRDDIVRYAPSQRGVWRVRNEIAAPYRINQQGWNNGSGDYRRQRSGSSTRIAVIGDSFVEAFQVASTDSFAEQLKRSIERDDATIDVLRFGISGAPLSQYVHMAEREVASYRPDWIVVSVIHNDFDESYRFVQGRYTSSFMKFRVTDGKVTGEIPPTPWKPSWADTLRQTATARFFLYRWQVRPQIIVDLFLPRSGDGGQVAANVSMDGLLTQQQQLTAVTDHAVARLSAIAAGIGARLLLVMNGDLEAIYQGEATSPALTLNRILADAAKKHGVALIDMHPIFATHWAANHRRLNFETDGHWNELGHMVVGNAIAKYIRQSR